MNRKVLIISNPGKGENYCEGVNKDVENYKAFFTSALGGGWYMNEIKHLHCPNQYSVTAELDLMKDVDYSIVIFCGHGYYSSNFDETIVELQDNIDYRTSHFR